MATVIVRSVDQLNISHRGDVFTWINTWCSSQSLFGCRSCLSTLITLHTCNSHYTQSIFNYRLSRARRVVENSFGIAASRFRVWRRPLEVQPAMAIAISQAVAVLHNFCMEKETTYNPPSSSDHIDHDGQLQLGSWRKDAVEMENTFYGLQAKSCNRTSDSARSLRERLATYLVGPGQVPWQLEMINGK